VPLALELADEVALLGLMGGSLTVEPQHAPDLLRSFGRDMLFFQRRSYGGVSFVAVARPVAIEAQGRRRLLKVRIAAVRLFARPVETAEAPTGLHRLSREALRDIIAAGTAREEVAEAAQTTLASPTIETLAALYQAVLAAYDGHCALSHRRLSRADLNVVVLRPPSRGRPAAVSDMLPLALPFVPYFDAGLISVDEHHTILVDRARVPDEVSSALDASGRLYLPADPAHWPAPAALRHRRRRFAGAGDPPR
jgi:hypothetical protein